MSEMRRDNIEHVDRLGLCHRRICKCYECKKKFYMTNEHVYKHTIHGDTKYECSWTCYRKVDRRVNPERYREISEEEEREIEQEEFKKEDEKKLRKARMERCRANIRKYMAMASGYKPGTKERKNALARIRVYKKRLEEEMKGAKGKC